MRKLRGILLASLLASSMTIPSYASDNVVTENNVESVLSYEEYKSCLPGGGVEHFTTTFMPESQNRAQYVTVYGYDYTRGSVIYGSWRNGISGGSSLQNITLNFNYSYDTSYNTSFTASVSGSYTNGGTIGGNLGVTLGKSKSYSLGSGISVVVPKGSRYLIKYRPVYYRYKVVETKYMEAYLPGYGWDRHVVGTKTCYVNVFSHWDFTAVKN